MGYNYIAYAAWNVVYRIFLMILILDVTSNSVVRETRKINCTGSSFTSSRSLRRLQERYARRFGQLKSIGEIAIRRNIRCFFKHFNDLFMFSWYQTLTQKFFNKKMNEFAFIFLFKRDSFKLLSIISPFRSIKVHLRLRYLAMNM